MSVPERVRVLWLVKGLGPGGAETLLLSSARVADHDRFEYTVAYVLSWKDHLVHALSENGVRAHCLRGRSALHPRWVLRLRTLLRQKRFDIVHLHSPFVAGVARLLLRTLPAHMRPAVVSTEHNMWTSFSPGTRWLNQLLYRHDAARFAVSREVARTIPEKHRASVEVLVHGLVLDDVQDALRQREAARAELGFSEDDVVVGTVANFRAQKGYPDLLAAAAQVLERSPDVRFIAIGQGPLENEIKARHRELGLGDRFTFLGYRKDVLRVLGATDVFVLASLHEGFPVAVMEALAAGVPIVATAVGGVPDALTDGVEGLTVPSARPDLLAERLLEITGDAALRSRCAAAAAVAGQQFDIRRAVLRLEQVYADVAVPRVDA